MSTADAPTDHLTRQFLAWVNEAPRTYADAMEAWRTSCPRMTIWRTRCATGSCVSPTATAPWGRRRWCSPSGGRRCFLARLSYQGTGLISPPQAEEG